VILTPTLTLPRTRGRELLASYRRAAFASARVIASAASIGKY
jgi:hypothetical protein